MFDFDHCLEFFSKLRDTEQFGIMPAEELAKKLGVELPPSLKGAKVSEAPNVRPKARGTFSFTSVRVPLAAWFVSFLAKTKCYLVCVDHDDHVHCVHICITCFDGWPGPGCYIHGSYD